MSAAPLAYEDAGDGAAVVLLHGHPFDRSLWRPQLDFLASRFRVVAPDLRGYGDSPAVAGTATMDVLAEDVWALLEELGVAEAAVVGLSMGGLVAMEMATARPRQVWALGLVATTAEPVTERERAERLAMAAEVERAGMLPLVQQMSPRLFGRDPSPELVRRIEATMSASDPRGVAAALRGRLDRPDYRPRLRALDMPSLVCVGSLDGWSTAEVTHELVACLDSPVVLTLADAGHLPNLERPTLFNAALHEFLESVCPAHR